MKKVKVFAAKIIILACFTITAQSSYDAAMDYLKPACVIGVIWASGVMLYHDYQYSVAAYKAIKAERAREQLLMRIAENPKEITPHPSWWIHKHRQIEALKKTAAEHKNKALLSRLFWRVLS